MLRTQLTCWTGALVTMLLAVGLGYLAAWWE